MNNYSRRHGWRCSWSALLVASLAWFAVALPAGGMETSERSPVQFWFVRHAESELSVTSVYPSPDDGVSYPLTKRGMEQALRLADSLAQLPLTAIYTSTRLRAIQTADALAFRHRMPLNLAPEAAEIATGIPLAAEDFRAQYAELTRRWFAEGDTHARYEAGESLADVQRRFLPFVRELMNRHAHDTGIVIVVSHSGTLGLLVPMLATDVPVDFGLTHPLANTAIIKTELRDNTLVCLQWGETPCSAPAVDNAASPTE